MWERETERQRVRLEELTWLLRFSISKGWGERKQVSTEGHQAEGLPELPVAHIVIPLKGSSHLLGKAQIKGCEKEWAQHEPSLLCVSCSASTQYPVSIPTFLTIFLGWGQGLDS